MTNMYKTYVCMNEYKPAAAAGVYQAMEGARRYDMTEEEARLGACWLGRREAVPAYVIKVCLLCGWRKGIYYSEEEGAAAQGESGFPMCPLNESPASVSAG